jgi:hypothetical protein
MALSDLDTNGIRNSLKELGGKLAELRRHL